MEKSANGSPAPTGRNMSDNFPASSITTTNVGNAKITSSVHGTGHIENKDVEFSNVKNVETSKMSKEEASKVVASPNNGPRVNSIVNKGLKYTSAQNNINSSNGQNSRIHNEGVNTAILVQTIENGTNSGIYTIDSY